MKLPYIVAEIGLNHGGDFQVAMDMVYQAAQAGASAVKFQAVIPETLCSKNSPTYFQQVGETAKTQREFFERVTPFTVEQYQRLASWANHCGVDFGCTAFDVETLTWLDPLVKWHKVASADITNLPLLDAIAATGKPVFLSTGASTSQEIDDAVTGRWMWHQVTLLHCVLAYPTPLTEANLGAISEIRQAMWDAPLPSRNHIPRWMKMGYSDHTLFNLDVLTTAWLLGATVIEKHFSLDKNLSGNDHYHSMDPTDLRALVAKFKELQVMIGDGEKRVLPCEEAARREARRSLHATRDLPAGHILTRDDLCLKRPGHGLAPDQWEHILGAALAAPIQADDALTMAHILAMADAGTH